VQSSPQLFLPADSTSEEIDRFRLDIENASNIRNGLERYTADEAALEAWDFSS
jgi:hypothetical protein